MVVEQNENFINFDNGKIKREFLKDVEIVVESGNISGEKEMFVNIFVFQSQKMFFMVDVKRNRFLSMVFEVVEVIRGVF